MFLTNLLVKHVRIPFLNFCTRSRILRRDGCNREDLHGTFS